MRIMTLYIVYAPIFYLYCICAIKRKDISMTFYQQETYQEYSGLLKIHS